jgi:integrase
MKTTPVTEQPLQRVFRVDDHGVAAGFPPEAKGANFLWEAGKDFTVANDFLYGIHIGSYEDYRITDRPPWMNAGKGKDTCAGSKKAFAQALARGLDTLGKRGIDVLDLSNADLKLIARDLRQSGLESGIGAIQTAILSLAQWCAWRGLRGPVQVQHSTVLINVGARDDERPYEVIKIGAIEQQPSQIVRYIDTDKIEAITDEMRKQPDGHWRAFATLAKTGVRSGEVGTILDADVRRASDLGQDDMASFTVRLGKGAKKRHPEMPRSLIADVDSYRAVERRIAVSRILAAGKKAPAELFLKKDGTPVTYASLRRAVKKACKVLGIDVRLHWLRHTYAADYLVGGMIEMWMAANKAKINISMSDLNTMSETRQLSLMRLLGHTSLTTTAIYLAHAKLAFMAKLKSIATTEH